MAKTPATPKAAQKQKMPPLVDSPDAKEIFVSEVVGAGVIGGCVTINLATHRWTVSESGQNPEFSRVIVNRLVLTGEAAIQLTQHLAKLSAQAGQQAATKKPAGKPAGNGKPTVSAPKGKK